MQAPDKEFLDKMLASMKVNAKVWVEWDDEYILGKGANRLLQELKNSNSLKKAASKCKYSYKYAWNLLQRIKNRTGESAVNTKKGGKGGGGEVTLTWWGEKLLEINEIIVREKDTMVQRTQKLVMDLLK